MSRRGWLIAGVFVALLALGGPIVAIATDSARPEQRTPPLDLASASAATFLNGFVKPTGQVTIDPGQETQAQAQGWALLIAAANGDSARFKSILGWTEANVASSDRTTEVSLDIAWALAAGATRLNDPSYTGRANALASDIVTTKTGLQDNGIFFLGMNQLQGNSRVALRSMVDNQRSFLEVQMKGPRYSSLPLSANQNYSGDAHNQPLNLATSCDPTDKDRATYIWTKLRQSRETRTANALSADGKVVDKAQSVRATVASAAAAQAAGEQLQAYGLLDDADGIQKKHPTTQGAAWDALGRILLTTPWLGTCS